MIRKRFFIAVLSIVVTDVAFSNVHIFDPQGSVLRFTGQPGPRPGRSHLPARISIDENDRIAMADQLNGGIQAPQYIRDALRGRTP